MDISTGLYHYGARHYDARLSVWMSPDPILAQYMAGQPNGGVYVPGNLGLYTYTLNSPIVLVDPDGRAVGDPWYKRVGKVAIGVAFGTVQSLAPGGFLTDAVARPTNDSDFLAGQAAGQFATGTAQVVSGGATIAGGAAGTVVTAGVAAPAGAVVAVAGAATVAQGASNVGASGVTLSKALEARKAEMAKMSGSGGGGGGGGAPRNAHLAGKTHPKTGVPFDAKGYPDFKAGGHVKAEVKIKPTGTRAGDFRAANEAAGLKKQPEGMTWHHHQDGTTMQLVPSDIHRATGHTGGFTPRQ